MMGPAVSVRVFNAYVGLVMLVSDRGSLFEVALQAWGDNRLTFNQRDALATVIRNRELILGFVAA